jgi:hypothetical protein
MATSYFLTVEVESPHIEGGLGYMLAFRIEDRNAVACGREDAFDAWREEVRQTVLRAGDTVFSADSYTRKLAIAELMYEIEKINSLSGIKIGGVENIPAVTIQSTNPHDKKIAIDFIDDCGQLSVTETQNDIAPGSYVRHHGRAAIAPASQTEFPFCPPARIASCRKMESPRFG